MGFRLVGSFSPPSPLSLSECKESRLCVLNFRSWEMEFLNPEGVELPPPPPPPMIPPHVVMLVAEEKPVELFTNTSTPKLIPMARPANGTKGAKDSDQPFQSGGEQVLWRERIAYCGGDQPFQNASPGRGSEHVGSEGDGTRVEKQFHSKTLKLQISFDSSSLEAVWVLDIILRQNVAKQFFLKSKQEQYGDGEEITCSEYFAVYKNLPVCESADFPCITVAKLKKPAYFPLEDNECDCIRNLQRDGVEPLLINLCPSPADASTTMIVKHGHVLDLLTASQIDWMKVTLASYIYIGLSL
ncbi:protein argonaute 4B-like isoform X2 [Malus domestica]|uniref:protein argonaute 4B-like isoform X2 n=1 Tax=Malus domestica TaxID=3750 RepID=UPI00397647B3